MKIYLHVGEGGVEATFEIYENGILERVCARGPTLTEAVENLVVRFKQLQDAALHEMVNQGVIRVEPRAPKGEAS